MRVMLVAILVAGGLTLAVVVAVPGRGDPETCPAMCDRIPNTAWIDQHAVPLDGVYHWPALAAQATPLTGMAPGPQFRFEELCGATPVPQDPRESAVAARATVAQPDGQWQLQAQILHWRGDTARGGPTAADVFGTAVAALRACQQRAPQESPSITNDTPNRLAAVISGPVVMHVYLLAHVASSTISELTLWAAGPPQVPWPVLSDDAVLGSLTAPLCEAYIASCP